MIPMNFPILTGGGDALNVKATLYHQSESDIVYPPAPPIKGKKKVLIVNGKCTCGFGYEKKEFLLEPTDTFRPSTHNQKCPECNQEYLQAAAIANDCYRYIMDLCTNDGIVSNALKFVERKKEQLDTLQKIDERIEDMEEQNNYKRSILKTFHMDYFLLVCLKYP